MIGNALTRDCGYEMQKAISRMIPEARGADWLAIEVQANGLGCARPQAKLKMRLPQAFIGINGGIADLQSAASHMAHVDGVMMGRAAYQDPWRLLAVDPLLFGDAARFATAKAVVEALVPYVGQELSRGVKLSSITRHILGLFRGVPGARAFRRHLATEAVKPGAGVDVLTTALALVVDSDAPPAHIAA